MLKDRHLFTILYSVALFISIYNCTFNLLAEMQSVHIPVRKATNFHVESWAEEGYSK